MLKKKIKYTDENDQEVTRTFHFNLTKAETIKVTILEDLENVAKSEDPKAIIPVFENVIRATYGERLPDGRFVKRKEDAEWFISSDAFSELFLELLRDGEQGIVDFISAVVPKGVDPEAAGVAQPQDYKPSAREIAEERKMEAAEKPIWPSDEKRVEPTPVPVTPTPEPVVIEAEVGMTDAEREDFKRWREAQKAARAEETAISRPPHESGPGKYQV